MPLTMYFLPPTFYDDHRCRDLPEEGVSRQIGTRGRSVIVEMDEPAFRDIYTDALYYTDSATASQMGLPGLASSARATLKALRKQNPDLTATIDEERRETERRWLTR